MTPPGYDRPASPGSSCAEPGGGPVGRPMRRVL